MTLDKERLADALRESWSSCFSLPRIDIYGDEGDALITAILNDIEAQGYVIMPRPMVSDMLAFAEAARTAMILASQDKGDRA
jgi:hypothetical protein